MAIESGCSLRGSRRRSLVIVSLFIVIVLVCSLCVYMFLVMNSDGVRVKSAVELRNCAKITYEKYNKALPQHT